MSDLITILFVLAVVVLFLFILVAFGHGVWLVVAAMIRSIFRPATNNSISSQTSWRCVKCNTEASGAQEFCGVCGSAKPSGVVVELLKDLAATDRQLERFRRSGKLEEAAYLELKGKLAAERLRLVSHGGGAADDVSRGPSVTPTTKPEPGVPVETVPPSSTRAAPPSVVTASFIATDNEIVIEPVPSFLPATTQPAAENAARPTVPVQVTPRRRPFSEVLNAFMEESNIRWGEIIGGLLIIGCSTALTVSLWAEISQIPVLKFLIFTTVTAVLFGIGLYTEHRWKLPTTSRGILTIATLLVPLNFLAIAAVSSAATGGALVIGSEVLAPAIFLCLVYFAGRVITPGCAELLSAGVLGSSIGQLLVRHFAFVETKPGLLIFLGAFPVTCYVVTVGLTLRRALTDNEIDETETTTVFTMLGTMSFAALLPFGLLLYKAGPIGLTMMYLAPIVTLWGLPMLATGTVLWRLIKNKELVASRTAGTALGVLGVMIVLAGMVLAWPNPSSIVPAALLNFAILTALAVALDLPVAHLIAAGCFSLAYLVLFHVFAAHVAWQNLRVTSLLDVTLSFGSGQAMVGLFALFLAASEWLTRQKRSRDSFYYLLSACVIAFLSLFVVTTFGFGVVGPPHEIWIVYGIYSIGAFWIAWSRKLTEAVWAGSLLLLFSLAQGFAQSLEFSFPWQTAFLTHATICGASAIAASRLDSRKTFTLPLNYSAILSSVLALLCLLQGNPWEVTSMQAERVFWISGIWLLSLWLNRRKLLFSAFQIAVTSAVVLSVKATLQHFEWNAYLPHAFLHPWSLQIQGTVLLLLGLIWITLRLLLRREASNKLNAESSGEWINDAWKLLDANYSVDRVITWAILVSLMLLAIYGAISGVTRELTASYDQGFNIGGFPHQEVLGLGSWILLGLMTVTMLAHSWERRSGIYLAGAVAALSTGIPLLAGRFENQIATATAWRYLAIVFLIAGSLLIWNRERVAKQLALVGWPQLDDLDSLWSGLTALLLALTLVPLALLTIYPAISAIYYIPVRTPATGIFSLLDNNFSYSVPLAAAGLVLISYGIREKKTDYAVAAGVFFNATVTIAYLLTIVAANASMDRVVSVRLLQLNAITLSLHAIWWLSTRRTWEANLDEVQLNKSGVWLARSIWLAVGFFLLVVGPSIVALILAPDLVGKGTFAAGGFFSWLMLLTNLLAAGWYIKTRKAAVSATLAAAVLLSISAVLALTLSPVNVWMFTGLHVLTVAVTVSAWIIFLFSRSPTLFASGSHKWWQSTVNNSEWERSSRKWAGIAGTLAVGLALRPELHDPSSDWWAIIPLLVISALAAALNWQTLKRRYLYAAGVVLNIAVSVWWLDYVFYQLPSVAAFLYVNIIAACLPGIVWLWLELRSRRITGESERSTEFSFHNLTVLASLFLLAALVLIGFGFQAPEYSPVTDLPLLAWLTFLSVLSLMFAILWDAAARYTVGGLYVLGLIGGAQALQQLTLSPTRLGWTAMMFLAIYSLGTALLWRWRRNILNFARMLGIPGRMDPEATELAWLSAFNILAVAAVIGIAYWIDLRFMSFGLRSTAAIAVIAQCVTCGLFAGGRWRERWQRASIGVFVTGLVFIGWATLTPGLSGTWLNRSVILMVATFVLTAVYGLGLNKARAWRPAWMNAARACVPWVLGAGFVALIFCLGTEVFYQISFGAVRIRTLSLIAIGLTLTISIFICLLFALSTSHDPLSLSERGRMNYVYAAEGMLALLFLHVRLTMPWMFTGFFERYWPLIVMAVAYLGVVTSESLRRRRLLVLSQPIERTGAFLPLLPVLGFWLTRSDVDYSALLFVVGGLYGLLSLLRRSFLFGLLAAVAGNGGLWYLFHRSADYQFLQHPQLWLIPVAASVLLAAYLNEKNLTEDQLAGVRYLSLVTIYASSTADIFINGVANSPWLPLVLGGFSLAGVFSGIVFRIRGLLLLGSVFLLLAIITMIWYASANLGWTWLWYVAGIVTGATIIFMFAVFEKKRSEVLAMMEGLKEWER